MIQTRQFNTPAGMIDLGIGQPQLERLPHVLLKRAAQEALTGQDNSLLNYGPVRGDGYFRVALANFLSAEYGLPVEPETLMATGGSSQALAMLAGALARPGDVVLVEEPTYFLAHQIFADAGLKVVGVSMGPDGVAPEDLAEAVARYKPKLFYTIPVHQNPSGITLSPASRSQIVEICRNDGVLVLADEVYQLLTYQGQPPTPMARYLDSETVISLGSFSKILAPGLRLGWLQAPPQVLERVSSLGMLNSGGGINQFTGCLVKVLLESGAQESYLQELRSLYRGRVDLMDTLLREQLGDRVSFEKPQGGYFFWLRVSSGQDTQAALPIAEEHGLGYRAGPRFSTCGRFHDCLRLSFAHYEDHDLREAVARLGRVF